MKKIITLIAVSFILAQASAEEEYGLEIHCQTKTASHQSASLLIKPPVSPYRTNGITIYEFSVWGHSRNTYTATYWSSHNEEKSTRSGYSTNIKKLKDSSTWNDMPEELTLDSIIESVGNEFILMGAEDLLIGSGPSKQIIFDKELDCKYTQNN